MNMDEYVKLQLSFKEKIILLFTGHFNKKYLISKSNETIIINNTVSKDTNECFLVSDETIEDIPFFDFESKDEIKSNLQT